MIKFIIVFDSYLTRQIYLGLKLIETRCRDRNFLQSQGNGISRFPFYRIFIVPPLRSTQPSTLSTHGIVSRVVTRKAATIYFQNHLPIHGNE